MPCDIVEMKAFVKQRLYVHFSNVMLGFERASLLGDSALMSSADKHLSLYVRLCEWAGSDKCLNSIGIKTTLTATSSGQVSKKQSPKDMVYLNASALRGVGQGIDTALDSYDIATQSLVGVLGDLECEIKSIVLATKACLNCLDHIIKCVKIIEYAVRIESPSEIVSHSDSDVASTRGDLPHVNTIEDARKVLRGMSKDEARQHCHDCRDEGLYEHEEVQLLWVGFVREFLQNEDIEKPNEGTEELNHNIEKPNDGTEKLNHNIEKSNEDTEKPPP